MKNKICYILYTEDPYPIDSCSREDDRFLITVMKINPNLYDHAYMRKYDEVYCDARFSQKKYERIVNEIFKPLVNNDGGFYWV